MATGPDVMQPAHLAACGIGGAFAALALDATGVPVWRCDLDIRAHDIVADPARGICAVMGRKPGRGALICDLANGVRRQMLAPFAKHSFDGHGVFSADGRHLFTTQSAERTQDGRIVIYDLATGAVAADYSSHGIEPHELIWATPEVLAIGNGGIVDRFASDAIDSSLVLLNAIDGSVRHRWVLDDEWESLSIRHLAMTSDGGIAFAMQDQDAATDRRPLVGIAGPGDALSFLDIPPAVQARLDGYIGSIAVDRSGAIIAASAPRGGMALFWAAADQRYLGAIELPDVCGLAPTAQALALRLTSGHGRQCDVTLDAAHGILALHDIQPASALAAQWDNHLAWTGAQV
jgi:hypothetical protein